MFIQRYLDAYSSEMEYFVKNVVGKGSGKSTQFEAATIEDGYLSLVYAELFTKSFKEGKILEFNSKQDILDYVPNKL